jgi:hypothetical protein
MISRKLCLGLGLLAVGACATDGDGASTADEKLAARARMQPATADSKLGGNVAAPAVDLPTTTPGSTPPSAPTRPAVDDCASHNWYGDGECDAWCPKGDPKDCAPATGGVVCAAFFSPADGYCNRADPCGPAQDEDCQKAPDDPSCDPGIPRPQPGDGKCEPKTFAEFKADPDCAVIACPAIFSPADGKCAPRGACDFVIDEDCQTASGGGTTGSPGTGATTPIACIEIQYPTNGKCEAAKGCEYTDADCANSGSGVACDAIAYPINGKCEAPKGCEANDPDCGGVICITIAYAKNGKCEAAKGCEASDPDC